MQAEARKLLEAAEWRLLELMASRPQSRWREELRALSAEVGDGELKAAAAAVADSDEGSYLRLFGPGGAVSPRAVPYRPMEDPGRLLADLAGRYAAFRYQPGGEEPADHLATEVGFAGYLCLKRAYAESRGDEEQARITGEALTGFLEDHLAPLADAVSRRFDALGIDPPLAGVARALAKRTAPFHKPAPVSLPMLDDDGELDCACGEP